MPGLLYGHIRYPKSGLWSALGIFLTNLFFLSQEEENMQQMLNTLYLQNSLHGHFFVTEHSTR